MHEMLAQKFDKHVVSVENVADAMKSVVNFMTELLIDEDRENVVSSHPKDGVVKNN